MSAFNKMLSKARDRDWGGTSSNIAAEPYISGYGFVKWYLPDSLTDFIGKLQVNATNQQTKTAGGYRDAANQLSAACIGLTPAGLTLDFLEYHGTTGMRWGNPDKVTYGSNITLKYLEMSGMPIYRIHKCWFEMIRENKCGLHTEVKHIGKNGDSQRENWAGGLLYWTTKPDGVTVEHYTFFSGVTPSRDAQDNLGFDLQTIDKVEVDYEYHIDYIWNEPWVYDMAVKAASKVPYGVTGATRWSRDGFRSPQNYGKSEESFKSGFQSTYAKANGGTQRVFS